MTDHDEAAVQAAAEVMFRQYASQYSADHLTWRDFADDASVILAAARPHLVAAERERHRAERDAMHEDLALLLRTLGLGDHARPQSPHEVMLEAISEVGRLRQIAQVRALCLGQMRGTTWARMVLDIIGRQAAGA